jgi:hypothetical protein
MLKTLTAYRCTRTDAELVAHVKQRIARFKAPRRVSLRRPAEDRHREDPEVQASLIREGQRRHRAIACRVVIS